MKRLQLLGAFLLLHLFCFGQLPPQAYHPLPAHQTNLFTVVEWSTTTDTALFATRVDSTRFEGADSAFYLYRITQFVNQNTLDCFGQLSTPNAIGGNRDHYLGQKMLRAANGDCRFVFSNGDTFLLRTWAPLGTLWEWGSGDSMRVDSVRYQSVLGQMDSVKYFSLQSGPVIALSRTYGFVEVFSFIPFMQAFGSFTVAAPFHLWGIPTLGLGGHLPDYGEIFQLDPGDIFGYTYYSYNAYSGSTSQKINCAILSQALGSRFVYSVSCDTLLIHLPNGGPVDSTYFGPGIQTRYYDSLSAPSFIALPNEFRMETHNGAGGLVIQFGTYLRQGYHGRVRYDYRVCQYWDSCAQIFPENPNYPTWESYAAGLGKTGQSRSSPNYGNSYGLYCYEKASDSSGFCLDLGTVIAVSPSLEGKLTLSPNPSAGRFRLLWDAEWTRTNKTITVLSMAGKVLAVESLAAGTAALDLDMSFLAAGMYVLHVAAEGTEDAHIRFMVAR